MKKYIQRICVALAAFILGSAVLSLAGWDLFRAPFFHSLPDSDAVKVEEGPLRSKAQTKSSGTQLSDLFVFVGEKIEVVEYSPPNGEVWFDSAFDAKYRILEPVYGAFNGDTIEFRVFDHYGFPPFAKFKHVLLFVSKEDGKLYHEKYQYYDVYQTVDGRWASCGDPYRGMDYHRKPFDPKPLPFHEPIKFPRPDLTESQFKAIYPAPYFEAEGKTAICKMGAYVEELFQIKRDSILKARGVALP